MSNQNYLEAQKICAKTVSLYVMYMTLSENVEYAVHCAWTKESLHVSQPRASHCLLCNSTMSSTRIGLSGSSGLVIINSLCCGLTLLQPLWFSATKLCYKWLDYQFASLCCSPQRNSIAGSSEVIQTLSEGRRRLEVNQEMDTGQPEKLVIPVATAKQ